MLSSIFFSIAVPSPLYAASSAAVDVERRLYPSHPSYSGRAAFWNLSLTRVFLSEEDAIVCLRHAPSVVELQITMGFPKEISAKFLAALTSPDTPLLPNLRSLTIQGYVVFNAEELKEMLVCRWARPEKFSRSFSQLKISSRITRLCVVLFLPRPQNRAKKCLHNLRTFKLRRVNITSSPWTLDAICVALLVPSPQIQL
jgi:hypothetical protein